MNQTRRGFLKTLVAMAAALVVPESYIEDEPQLDFEDEELERAGLEPLTETINVQIRSRPMDFYRLQDDAKIYRATSGNSVVGIVHQVNGDGTADVILGWQYRSD
jgi:hypothetical protein